MNKNYGYACINETLKKEGVTTNRSLKKATLDKKGLEEEYYFLKFNNTSFNSLYIFFAITSLVKLSIKN